MDETIRSIDKVNKYNRSNDIIFKLKPNASAKTNSIGMVDGRLFSGENRLHAIMDTQTCLWHLAYDNGTIPGPLKGRFTSYRKILEAVEDYFNKRNIEIVDIIDHAD